MPPFSLMKPSKSPLESKNAIAFIKREPAEIGTVLTSDSAHRTVRAIDSRLRFVAKGFRDVGATSLFGGSCPRRYWIRATGKKQALPRERVSYHSIEVVERRMP